MIYLPLTQRVLLFKESEHLNKKFYGYVRKMTALLNVLGEQKVFNKIILFSGTAIEN